MSDDFDNIPYKSVPEYIRHLEKKQRSYAHELELARLAATKHAKNAQRLVDVKEKHQAIKEELNTYDHRNSNEIASARRPAK